jgi:hypothetical protein
MSISNEGVRAMIDPAGSAPTAPLGDVLAAMEEDPNLWWRMGCGHHENLFDDAVDRLTVMTAENARLVAGLKEAKQRIDAILASMSRASINQESLAKWLVEEGLAEAERGYGHASGEEVAAKLAERFEFYDSDILDE